MDCSTKGFRRIDVVPPQTTTSPPGSCIASVALFVDVKNPLELRSDLQNKRLITQPEDITSESKIGLFDVSLVKARLILDWRQAGAAAAKAATSVSRDRAVARSLGAEVLYYLSSGKNVGEALRLFGINEGDDAVLAIVIARTSDELTRAETQLVSKIKGQVAPDVQVGLEALNESFNGQEFSKTYKLKKTEVGLDRDTMAKLLISRTACKDLM